MKKFLRVVLILLIVIVVGFLALGLFAPKEMTMVRTVVINAPKSVVREQIVNFKNWPNWSPWYKMEPTMTITYSGPDGAVGSSYHWVGKKMGEGEMKLAAETGDHYDFDLHFIKPIESSPKSFMEVLDTAGMTKVSWGFAQTLSYPLNGVMMLINMKDMLAKDFDGGLNNMKAYIESHPVETAGTGSGDIKEVEYPAQTLQGMRKTVGWDGIGSFCGQAYPALGQALEPKIAGNAVAIYYTWDTVKHSTDMFAGFPVSDATTKVKDAIVVQVPATKALMAVHKGGYSSSMNTHMALMQQVAAKGLQQQMAIEEYVVGPGTEKDSTKYVTNIYYLVK